LMSSLRTAAQRPSKWATAAIVASTAHRFELHWLLVEHAAPAFAPPTHVVVVECPSPMVWPISCVATSPTLHWFQTLQLPHPLLNVTLPMTICENMVPLTVVDADFPQTVTPPVQ
jgi:hypothetical protein